MEKNQSPVGTDEKRSDLGPLSGIVERQKNYATKNVHEINPHSSKPSIATPCIKALKRDNIRRDGCDHWLFFDDWKIDATEVKEDPAEYFNCTDYDPVDHVSILLGHCTLDECVSMEEVNDKYGQKKKSYDSVWQRRRRAVNLEKGLSTGIDSILSTNDSIDNDGFLFTKNRSISHIRSARQGENDANAKNLTKEWITFS